MQLTEQIAILERALKEHIRKWDMFFSGVQKVPPQTEKDRIARRLRLLTEETINRRADQFRIEQLQHRFMTYSQNWERMLREREEGRTASTHTKPELHRQGTTNVSRGSSVDEAGGDVLFDRYCAAKGEQGHNVGVDRATFDEQIAVQRQKIEERLGRKVRFQVRVEDGNVRVVARKIKEK
jgi:hypothetical protein